MIVAYAPGVWDMFHVGHLRILQRARLECDHLVVGVATDELHAEVEGRPPVIPFGERCEVVESIVLVDEVVPDFSSEKLDVWRRVGFSVLFRGDDWRGTPEGDRLEAEMGLVGVAVRYFPYTPHTTSTRLRALLAQR